MTDVTPRIRAELEERIASLEAARALPVACKAARALIDHDIAELRRALARYGTRYPPGTESGEVEDADG